MTFELIRERKLSREEMEGYRRASRLFVPERREALRILAGTGLLFLLPKFHLIGTAHALIPPWGVRGVALLSKSIPKGNAIPAEVTVANISERPSQARVELEYLLPSGLSGQQATTTVSIPAGTERTFNHASFIARELGDSVYEATATGDGDGKEQDDFEVT